MGNFLIAPHMRLHEWVAKEKGYFDEAELDLVNARLLHETPYADVKDRLDAMGVAGGEEFWLFVRANLNKLGDAAGWSTVVYAPMSALAVFYGLKIKRALLKNRKFLQPIQNFQQLSQTIFL